MSSADQTAEGVGTPQAPKRAALPKLARADILLIITLLIAETASAIELTMIYTAMPAINLAYDGAPGVAWVVTASLLSATLAAAVCGRLGDLFGRRRVLLCILPIAATGSFISSFAPGLNGVIVGASLQGVAGAILPTCLALARERLGPERAPMSTGMIMMAATVSSGLGLAIGGLIVHNFGWRAVFIPSGICALVALAAVLLFIPKRTVAAAPVNDVKMLQGLMFAPGLLCLMLAISQFNRWGITDPRTLGLLAAAALILFLWARNQLGQTNPLINLRQLSQPQLAIAYFCMTLVAAGMMQHTLLLSMLLQQPSESGVGAGLNAAEAGAILSPTRLIGLIASPLSGWLVARYAPKPVIIAGILIAFGGWTTILLFNNHLNILVPAAIIEAAGFMIVYVAIPVAIMEAATADRRGEALGAFSVCQQSCVLLGAQVLLLILSSHRTEIPGLPGSYPAPESLMQALTYVICMCLAALAVACFLPRRKLVVAAPSAAQPSAAN